MLKVLVAATTAFFWLNVSGIVLAQDVRSDGRDDPNVQEEMLPPPHQQPPNATTDEEYLAAMKRCLDLRGPEQQECFEQAKQQFKRM